MPNLDKWWSSLTVAQKERIATKANKTATPYPECTTFWNSLPFERRKAIYEHCVDAHGYLLKEWKDGVPFGD